MNARIARRLRKKIQNPRYYERRIRDLSNELTAIRNLSPSYWEVLNWEQVEKRERRTANKIEYYKRSLNALRSESRLNL